MSLRNDRPRLFEPSEEELRAEFAAPDLSGASSPGGQIAGMICHGIALVTLWVGFTPMLVAFSVGGDSGGWAAATAKVGLFFHWLTWSVVGVAFNFVGRKLYGRKLIVSIPQIRDPQTRAMMLWGDWLGFIGFVGSFVAMIVGALVLRHFSSYM